ncbi:2-amino-5-chloromuconate deaminase CnbZ [Desertibaculum subflavum]|uniref:2-amino-5-chloromuconate deaminase CnbZ n=1 Tax=Desertibaculum subflavum TaxID=2268458 RepID=UPI000E6761F9
MAEVLSFADGNYRFVKGVFPYSAGVAALPGFGLERARFRKPVAVAEGFRAIAAHLEGLGRPKTAFAACELRSPAPFTEEGFVAFNRLYVGTLTEWKIFRDGVNPVARSNVCPEIDKPAEPAFYAFTYTVPATRKGPEDFVVAGSGEAPEGHANYRDHITARGDISPAGLKTKARWVLSEMERRLGALGKGWADVTETQAYTVHDLHPFLAGEIVARGAASGGLTWHFARPPVVELEYEMDCRGVAREIVI